MLEHTDPLEKLWSALLSRNAKMIMDAYNSCTVSEKHYILKHLKKMTTEPGWHIEQVKSAEVALAVLEKKPK